MADKYLSINASGAKVEVEASTTSAGAADAGKIAALNPSGVLDDTMVSHPVRSQIVNVSGSYILDIDMYNKWDLVLQGNTSLTFDISSMPVDATSADIIVIIRQDSIGGYTPTFPYGTQWPGGVIPTWNTAPDAYNILRGFHIHTSSLWYFREES